MRILVFKIIFVILQLTIVNCQLSILHSQNLVYNPGFESDSGAVIHDYSQWRAGNTIVDGWYVPTDGTSDYYNSHESTIKGHPIPKARTGQGRIGMIWSNAWQYPYREFVTGRLIRPLEKDKKYKVSFYICRYKYAHYSPMQIGAYFSQDSMIQRNYYANIKVNPQMKIEDYTILEDRKYWHKVEAVFTAAGGERYITLGNFKQTINDLTSPSIKVSSKFTIVATQGYAYCFVDDVCVEEYDEQAAAFNENKPKLFLYLVDQSSSMSKEDKFERMKKGIKRSVKNLPADASFSIVGFSKKANVLVAPTKALLYDFADVLDTVKVAGQTDAVNAINTAYDLAEQYPDFKVELIMCTDGQFKLDDTTFYRVIGSDIRFNLLQIGGRRIPYLEQLMNSTGGKYVVTQNKHIKEEMTVLSSSVSSDLREVEYTRAKKGRVIAKWALLACVVALVFTL